MRACAELAGTKVVGSLMHTFTPQGVTGVLLLEESHVSIHTWPEQGYAAVDFYTCGTGDLDACRVALAAALGAASCEVRLLERGGRPS